MRQTNRGPGAVAAPLAGLILATSLACGGGGAGGSGAIPPMALSFPSGSRYFQTADGRRAPVLMRNVSAPDPASFLPLFQQAQANGTTVVRLQLTQGLGYDTLGIDHHGEVLPAFASAWDAVIDGAAQRGLDVIIVFAIWGDWNDGTPSLGWTHFGANPLNQALGGPAASPSDLFSDSETQRDWLAWLQALVTRWSGRTNVVAWETFSELDLASGATEATATAFAERAAEIVRSADPAGRPVYASTSDLPLLQGRPWAALWASSGCDLASLHTYNPDLDQAVITRMQTALAATDKPILLGESGLDAGEPDGTTLTSSSSAAVGLESAIWAELVSGSVTARALYWEDGYAAYYPTTGLALVAARNQLERRAADWLAGKDFDGLAPLELAGSPPLVGAALGNADRVLGWARDANFVAPAWDAAKLQQADVRVTLPAGASDSAWTVTLTAPDDGSTTVAAGASQAGMLAFKVATPFNRVAFEATRVSAAAP